MCFYRDILPAKIVGIDNQLYELKTTDKNELVFTVHKSMLPFHNPQKGDKVGLRLTKLGSQLFVRKCVTLDEQQDKHIKSTELIAGEVMSVNSRRIEISTFDGNQETIVYGFPKRDNRCPAVSPGDPVLAEVTKKKNGQLIATRIRTKPAFANGVKRETTGRIPSRK
jgi:exosome complex RNA-binding protein Csl4